MGLDLNAIKVLLWSKNLGVSFERTVTLGHQGLDCSPRRFRDVLDNFGFTPTSEILTDCLRPVPGGSLYADQFLRFLGAKEVVSVDRSDFEGATLLQDLNEPFPESLRESFSLVLDGGTLEHIFNYPQALRHSLELVALGGHFITIAPAHNFMGHGFYQLSPELFFRVFASSNGFALRKIILYDASNLDAPFFEVHDPAITGRRTELTGSQPMHLAVLAQRTSRQPILKEPPQQSDYAAAWQRNQTTPKQASVPTGWFERWRVAVNPYWPYWLRRLRRRLAYSWRRGQPSLSNQRQFRRVDRQEMFRERAAILPQSVQDSNSART